MSTVGATRYIIWIPAGMSSVKDGQQRQLTLFLREKVTKAPASLSPAEHNALSTMDPRFYNDHVANPGQGNRNPVNVDGYYFMRRDQSVTGQVHHLNQDVAFRGVIPGDDGLCVELHGNAFSEVDSEHYRAHNSMEQFWDQYRAEGEFCDRTPTVGQYNRALQDSLVRAGFTQDQARFAVEQAVAQQRHYGFTNTSPVPRVPGKIHQRR